LGRYFLPLYVVCLILVSFYLTRAFVPRVGWVQGFYLPLGVIVVLMIPCVSLVHYFQRFLTDPKRKFYRTTLENATRDSLRRQYEHGELDRKVGWQRLELRSRELVLETDFHTSVTPWSAVEKIVTTESHAFFYYNPQGAHVLPIQAFGSEVQFTAFVETARALKEAACRPGAADVRPEGALGGDASRQPGGVVEVAYKLTLEDSLAPCRVSSMRDLIVPSRRPLLLGIALIGVVIILMLGVVALPLLNGQFVFGPKAWASLLFGFLLLSVLLLLLFIGFFTMFPLNPLALRWIKKYRAEHHPHPDEATHRLRLTPDNLIQAVGDQVTARPWETVEEIVSTADHAFFRVSRAEVLILPKRAFAQEAGFTEFVETAKKYHQSARRS
jgi:hypothetical protein